MWRFLLGCTYLHTVKWDVFLEKGRILTWEIHLMGCDVPLSHCSTSPSWWPHSRLITTQRANLCRPQKKHSLPPPTPGTRIMNLPNVLVVTEAWCKQSFRGHPGEMKPQRQTQHWTDSRNTDSDCDCCDSIRQTTRFLKRTKQRVLGGQK